MNRWTIATSLFLISTIHIFGQGAGTFIMANVGTNVNTHIYVGEYLGPVKAEGDGYQIAIFYGPEGTRDESALIQIGASAGFLTGAGAGQFNGGGRTIFDTTSGGVYAFQARAWDVSTGATWAQAVANPDGQYGKGPIFDMKTKDPFSIENNPVIGQDVAWRGFAIVPEPSVWGLALLGVVGLLVIRRRRA